MQQVNVSLFDFSFSLGPVLEILFGEGNGVGNHEVYVVRVVVDGA